MANRLATQLSPYLLQHANNPVDWYPWGPEALAKARDEDKPIFLSIGYSACHWCHVMEHESFENQAIADLLNQNFVSIKVDREERPDLDQIYMQAVQMISGRGGWPMSVFMTAEGRPFFGGTYWPPTSRQGMPGFDQVLSAVLDAWRNRRAELGEQAEALTQRLAQIGPMESDGAGLRPELLQIAESDLERSFDFTHGGFDRAPKFPHPMDLQVLLRVWRRRGRPVLLDMVKLTLDKMAHGGIYDHLGGGFARYSVDARWLVPHFEKMLYDNALLAGAYLDSVQATGDAEHARVVRETLDYVLRDMTDPAGPFYSTEDADSEGEEGKFYVWSPAEIHQVLGAEAAQRFCYVYDVTEHGNFEGHNILNLPKTIEQCAALKDWDAQELRAGLAESRAKLLAVRNQRVRPGRDDKVLVSWNGLMIDSLSRAAGILHEPRYLEAAAKAAEFLCTRLRCEDGRLLHCWRGGEAKLDAYLDDYAALANGLVSLYEASFDERWVDEAMSLASVMMKRFRDKQGTGFFYTADDHEQLIARTKDLYDSSVPSASSLAATCLLRLGKLCGRTDLISAAVETMESAVGIMEKHPTAAAQMLLALDMYLGPMPEIVVLGDPNRPEIEAVLQNLRQRFLPNRVLACRSQADLSDGSTEVDPIFIGRVAEDPPPTVYICENFSCRLPATGPEAAVRLWDKLVAEAQTG